MTKKDANNEKQSTCPNVPLTIFVAHMNISFSLEHRDKESKKKEKRERERRKN